MDRLGGVRYICTLGSGHGSDENYLKSRYPQASFWTPETLKERPPPNVEIFDVPTRADGKHESICFIPHLKLLVTGGAVQNFPAGHSRSGGCRAGCGASWIFPFLGFRGQLVTPPLFLKSNHVDKTALLSLFAEVMTRDFDTIICGHGPAATQHVKETWAKSIASNPNLRAV